MGNLYGGVNIVERCCSLFVLYNAELILQIRVFCVLIGMRKSSFSIKHFKC